MYKCKIRIASVQRFFKLLQREINTDEEDEMTDPDVHWLY